MNIKSYNIDASPNEYNIVRFSQPDTIDINVNQVTFLEQYNHNGNTEFDILDEKKKKTSGVMYKLHMVGAIKYLFVTKQDYEKIRGKL